MCGVWMQCVSASKVDWGYDNGCCSLIAFVCVCVTKGSPLLGTHTFHIEQDASAAIERLPLYTPLAFVESELNSTSPDAWVVSKRKVSELGTSSDEGDAFSLANDKVLALFFSVKCDASSINVLSMYFSRLFLSYIC